MKTSQQWQSRQTMSTADYELFYYSDNHPSSVKLHHHDFYELYYFIKGDAIYSIEGRNYNLKNGDILFVSPNELHKLNIENNKIYERYVLWISEKFLKSLSTNQTNLIDIFEYKSEQRNNLLQMNDVEREKIKHIFESIFEYQASNKFGDDLLLHNAIIELLLKIYAANQSQEPSLVSSERPIIANILNFINLDLKQNLSATVIANKFYLSPSRLSHIFKDETGGSIHQYIIKKRLMYAKELIEKGLQINTIYAKCGINDYPSFFKAFKKEYGLSPKSYYNQFLKR